MAISIPLWLLNFPQLLREQRQQQVKQKNDIDAPALTQIVVDLACSDDIEQSLERCLDQLQRYLRFHLEADIYLIGMPTPDKHKLLHTGTVTPPMGLAAQLRYQLTEHSIQDANELRYKLPGSTLSIHALQLSLEAADSAGWIVLCFKDRLPNSEQINQLSAPVVEALSSGINGWSRQQSRINAAVSSEKAAHAAELHDSMAQILGYMRIKASRLAAQCKHTAEPELAKISEDLSHQAQCAYRQTRELIACSRLSIEQGLLVESITQAIAEFEQRCAMVFELDNRVGKQLLTEDDSQALFIIREALNNIVRHAHASHARVQLLRQKDGSVRIRIEDNGKGISADQARQDSFGMKIMQERATRIHANLFILPRVQGGTRIDLIIPAAKP
ncbi:ATP-binding protein [Amphritea sp. 1_MG-2023]|uniref:sensor histidine kinase n=1 Tax=Amphritea sp. 1_MG-2023 TaxID=3062670 RepID=UPI0026E3038C|nr:ATP-binding protein [Amphritea sp. 1_MG-2023]MDO6564980.1 ATP-binding protein [Amphritea sp. 1_MG-2023]